MNTSEDVKILFRRFGGEANGYQEVLRERAAGKALGKWAMLGQVDILHPQTVLSVHRSVNTAATRHVALEPVHTAPRVNAVHVVPPAPARQSVHAGATAALTRVPQQRPVPTTPVEQARDVTQVRPSALSTASAVVRSVEMTPATTSPFAAMSTKTPPATHPNARPAVTAATMPITPRAGAPVLPPGHRSALGNSLNARLLHASVGEDKSKSGKHSLAGLFGRLAKSTFSFTSAPHSPLQRKFAK